MNKLKLWIRNYFGFSQIETNGFIVLGGILVILLLVPIIFDAFSASRIAVNPTDQVKLNNLLASIQKNQPQKSFNVASNENSKSKEDNEFDAELFAFNPNEIDLETWQKLGLKKYLAERILKYRDKGGKFRKKADLKKIYGFPESLYEKLEPYIELPDNQSFNKNQKENISEKTEKIITEKQTRQFDLNTADTTTLKKIRGIGSKLSQRIIKYRDVLGGFYTLEQLKEVYGLSPEVIEETKKYAVLTTPVHKINLNMASAEILKTHPYIKKMAYTIVNYRQQHGNFQEVKDLLKISSMTPEIFQKLAPYLSVGF